MKSIAAEIKRKHKAIDFELLQERLRYEDMKALPNFILTNGNGKKICAGSYYRCDAVWGKLLDHAHYSNAGILWFIFEGQAYRMPGY